MTIQQLEALLIDQSFGELPEEVEALLEALLAQRDDLRTAAAAIREALRLTGEVVATRPAHFRVENPVAEGASDPRISFSRWLPGGAKFAAALTALALAAGAGYRSGQLSSDEALPTVVEKSPPADSPWARYRFEADGRLAVIPTNPPRS